MKWPITFLIVLLSIAVHGQPSIDPQASAIPSTVPVMSPRLAQQVNSLSVSMVITAQTPINIVYRLTNGQPFRLQVTPSMDKAWTDATADGTWTMTGLVNTLNVPVKNLAWCTNSPTFSMTFAYSLPSMAVIKDALALYAFNASTTNLIAVVPCTQTNILVNNLDGRPWTFFARIVDTNGVPSIPSNAVLADTATGTIHIPPFVILSRAVLTNSTTKPILMEALQ